MICLFFNVNLKNLLYRLNMRRLFYKLILSLRYRIKLQGVELSRLSQTVYISNLTSQLDPLLLAVFGQGQILIAARMIVSSFVEFWMRGWGVVFYPRAVIFGKQVAVRKLKKDLGPMLGQSPSLILFPQAHLGRADMRQNPLVQECSQHRQIVLVKIEGMRGSLFSAQPAEKRASDFFSLFKVMLKNFIFFMPRRTVTIRWSLMKEKPSDLNRYLEEYFHEMEPLSYVPYFFGKKKIRGEELVDAALLEQEIKRLAKKDSITLDQHLYQDLGLDSLDVTQLVVFIEKTFQQTPSFDHLQTVRDLYNAAAGKMVTLPYEKRSEAKLEKWHEPRPETDFPKSRLIPEAFLERVEEEPHLAACVDPMDVMTYERMKTLSVALSLEFALFQDEKIGVLLPTTSLGVCLVLGLMLAQKVPVMLNGTLGSQHLQEVARQARLATIITSYEMVERLPYELGDQLEEKLVFIEEIQEKLNFRKRLRALRLGRQPKDRLKKQLGLSQSSHDPAMIFFTTGSEKAPKGVPLSHENLLLNEKEAFDRLEFNSSDVLLGLLPPFHVYGFSLTILAPLMKGMRVVFYPSPLDFSGALEMVQKWKVTVLATTPTLLAALLEIAPIEKLSSLRMIVVGAEKTPVALRKRVENMGIPLVEGYGTTECSPLLTLNVPGKNQGVGLPLPSVQIKILDPEKKTPLPPSSQGLIVVQGPTIFEGYLGGEANPFLDLDRQKWYVTGDIGVLQKDGSLLLAGRMSRTVKIGGELISLTWIESLLQAPFAIVALEKEEGRPELIGFTTSSIPLEEANQLLRKAGLSNLIRLSRVIKKESFPLIGIGKIDYRKLQHEL